MRRLRRPWRFLAFCVQEKHVLIMSDDNNKPFHYGGQAVLEGVMMRGRKDFAVAVRKANGEIVSTCEAVKGILGRLQWLNKPLLRGTLMLIDSLALGIKALMYSANIAMADIEEEENAKKKAKGIDAAPKPNKVNDLMIPVVMVLGVLLALAIFKLVPIAITKPLKSVVPVSWMLTAIEGVVQIAIFIAYVYVISFAKDIRRVFQYHGAEHKTINAYEAGAELTVDGVISHTKVHVRCGTSFILVVLVASVFVYAIVVDHLPLGSLKNPTVASYFARWGYKICLLPFVAGLAYEVIRFAGRHKNSVISSLLVWPGLLMQKLTTREPEPEMIEVAIKSLSNVLEAEKARAAEAEAGSAASA